MLNIEQILRDNSIRYNIRKEGIIVVDCSQIYSHCRSSKGSKTLTGAFLCDKHSVSYYCFRCGSHHINEVLQLVTGDNNIRNIYRQYDRDWINYERKELNRPLEVKLPIGKSLPDSMYRNYLESRGIDVDDFIKTFKPIFTKHFPDERNVPVMNPIALANRIILPFYYEKEIVSWTSRSIDKNAKARYITCPSEQEVIPNKSILINLDNCNNDYCFVVEGPFDVIKGGADFAGACGISFTISQVNTLLKKGFKKVFVCFDPEPTAQEAARKFAYLVGEFIETYIVNTRDWFGDKDIGDLTKEEINVLKEKVLTECN